VIVVGQRRGRLDGVDADDRATQPLLVGTHLGGQVCERRFASVLAPQRFTRRLELASLAPHATWPGILTQGVNHRTADAPLGERLELDAALLIETARRINETDDAVLDEVADINRMWHRRRDTPGKLLDEGDAEKNARVFLGTLRAHGCNLQRSVTQRGYQLAAALAAAAHRRWLDSS